MAFADRFRMNTVFDPNSPSQVNADPGIGLMQLNQLAANKQQTDNNTIRNAGLMKIANDAEGAYRIGNLRQAFGNGDAGSAPNVTFNPGMTDYQKSSLGLERDKLDASKASGDEKLALQDKQFGLNVDKNNQIYETKMKDMQRKSDEAEQRLTLAEKQLQARKDDAAAQAAYHQAQIDAQNARHDLEMTQKGKELDELKRNHDAQIKDMQDKLDAASHVTTHTELGPDNTSRTTTVDRGSNSAPKTVNMTGPDGKTYPIPADKVEQAKKDGLR